MSAERRIPTGYDSAAITGAKAPAANVDVSAANGGTERQAAISASPWKVSSQPLKSSNRIAKPGDLFEGHVPLVNENKFKKPKKIPTW